MIERDTIYAVSSGAPPAAIAIVRISGPQALAIGQTLAGPLPEPRWATLRAIRDPRDKSLLDRALVLVFPAPNTATGEDLVEFHVHGGRAVVAAVEMAIGELANTRRAEPGEFTRRALENGVIDLTAAEGLGDLLSAQTETQRRAALRMAEGGVSALVDGWTRGLIAVAANIEAQLDFSDADDVTEQDVGAIVSALALIACEMAATLATPDVERLHEGVRVVIAGPPNSGKSTLLNTLTGRDVAIVSSVSGTTRDRIEAPVARAGLACILTDTAGLTDMPGDDIEAIGVARARSAIAGADIVIWLGDDPAPYPSCIAVHARADLEGRQARPMDRDIAISAEKGLGIDTLWRCIEKRARLLLPVDDTIAVNARQRQLIGEAYHQIAAAMETEDMLIMAEQIRLVLRSLDVIVGRSGIDEVLDAVFSKFCIGK